MTRQTRYHETIGAACRKDLSAIVIPPSNSSGAYCLTLVEDSASPEEASLDLLSSMNGTN